jgi:diguanylate cyclase (GGDEF)-like protein
MIKKYIKEILNGASPKAVEKILKQLEHKIEAISEKIDNELRAIKNLYSKNIEIIKEIESNSMFDQTYGVYNKNYFLKLLKKEIDLIDKFSHVSSIITIKIKDKVLQNFTEKSKILANRSMAKIILKTSRRTDIVSYIGDGIFAMLLKHTDRVGAGKTIERLADMISMSAVFLEGEEVELSIVGGVVEMKKKDEPTHFLEKAIKVMKEAEKEDTLYKVYEGD